MKLRDSMVIAITLQPAVRRVVPPALNADRTPTPVWQMRRFVLLALRPGRRGRRGRWGGNNRLLSTSSLLLIRHATSTISANRGCNRCRGRDCGNRCGIRRSRSTANRRRCQQPCPRLLLLARLIKKKCMHTRSYRVLKGPAFPRHRGSAAEACGATHFPGRLKTGPSGEVVASRTRIRST